jgi:hypothetical protein
VVHTDVHTTAAPAVLLNDMWFGLSRTGKVPVGRNAELESDVPDSSG